MPPAIRESDSSICAICNTKGAFTQDWGKVYINDKAATPLSFQGVYLGCCGHDPPDIFEVSEGVPLVKVQGFPAARAGGATHHLDFTGPGVLWAGSPNVNIGGRSLTMEQILALAKKYAAALFDLSGDSLSRWSASDRELAKAMYGSDSEALRRVLQERDERLRQAVEESRFESMSRSDPDDHQHYAKVYPDDESRTVHLGNRFSQKPTSGYNSQGGALIHEASHFPDAGNTDDYRYGLSGCRDLATSDPEKALQNADNNRYWHESLWGK